MVRAPQSRQLAGPGQWHVALVLRVCARFERNRFIPEDPQHFHPVAVVPYRSRDGSGGPRYSNHLLQRLLGIGYEIQDQQRERPVEARIREWKSLGVAYLEPYSW